MSIDDPQTPRERYLAAAIEIARQPTHTPPKLLGQIPFGELASRLGVSRSALYLRWPTRDEFAEDLNRFLSLAVDFARDDVDLIWTAHLLADPVDLDAPIDWNLARTEFNDLHHAILAEPWGSATVLQLVYGEEPELARIRARTDHRRLEQIATVIARRLHDYLGLQIKRPYTPLDVAAAFYSLGGGLYVINQFAPDIAGVTLDPGHFPWTGRWNLLALAYFTILVWCTEPVTAPVPQEHLSWPRYQPPELDAWTPSQLEALAAATELVSERLDGRGEDLPVLSHVTIERVARACGVSRRAVYNVWPKRDDLVFDLLSELLAAEHREFVGVIDKTIRHEPDVTIATLIDRMTLPRPADLCGELTQVVPAFLPMAQRERVRSVIIESHHRSVDHLAQRLDELDDVQGSHADGVTTHDLATVLVAMEAGARRLQRSCPGVARTAAMTGELSALGMAATALASDCLVQMLIAAGEGVLAPDNMVR